MTLPPLSNAACAAVSCAPVSVFSTHTKPFSSKNAAFAAT
jgi:hypothetical protein